MKKEKDWEQAAFDDAKWQNAYLVAAYGSAPWGNFARNLEALPAEKPKLGEAPSLEKRLVAASLSLPQQLLNEVTPAEDYPWPEGIVFLGDDSSLYRGQYPGTSHDTLSVTVFTTRSSRSYPEPDLPTPIKMGRKLYALKPARPGTQPRLLVDATALRDARRRRGCIARRPTAGHPGPRGHAGRKTSSCSRRSFSAFRRIRSLLLSAAQLRL